MRLSCLELERRDVPSSYIGNGLVELSPGVVVRPFEPNAVRVPLNVVVSGDEVAVGAGPGGGPRVAIFNRLTGNRIQNDFFAGDPESREGVIPIVFGNVLKPVDGVPYDLSTKGVVFGGGNELTPAQWQYLREQLDKVPPDLMNQLITRGIRINVVNGVPITDFIGMSRYAVELTVDGRSYSGVPAVGDPIVLRVDQLMAGEGYSSANAILHEIAHWWDIYALNNKLNGSSSQQWRDVHGATNWRGDPYYETFPEEGFAESFAAYLEGVPYQSTVDYWRAKIG